MVSRFHPLMKKASKVWGNILTTALEMWQPKSGLPEKFNSWIYQHSILPQIFWSLLIYYVPITSVETMQRRISGYLCRCLSLPRSLSSAALYGKSNILQLQLLASWKGSGRSQTEAQGCSGSFNGKIRLGQLPNTAI